MRRNTPPRQGPIGSIAQPRNDLGASRSGDGGTHQRAKLIRTLGRRAERMTIRVAAAAELYADLKPRAGRTRPRRAPRARLIARGERPGRWIVNDPPPRRYLAARPRRDAAVATACRRRDDDQRVPGAGLGSGTFDLGAPNGSFSSAGAAAPDAVP